MLVKTLVCFVLLFRQNFVYYNRRITNINLKINLIISTLKNLTYSNMNLISLKPSKVTSFYIKCMK